jgi:putative aldouronate transport system permease protein
MSRHFKSLRKELRMRIKTATGDRIFGIVNGTFFCILALLCLLPLVNVLAVSFSSSTAASAGIVTLWPVNFTLKSYQYAIAKPEFVRSFMVSVVRLLLGVGINMVLTIVCAYPLSKDRKAFGARGFYVWFFFITMIFSGGLIPWYMTIQTLGLGNSIWALILPGAVPVFNVILLLNFYRSLPVQLEESAYMDGAGAWQALWKIVVPLSTPALATIALFSAVGHWNSWFDGLVLMSDPKNYPLQSYLQTVVVSRDMTLYQHATKEQLEMLQSVSDRTTKAAQIFIATLPILLAYPFLQRYFVKGLTLGGVKG